MPMSQTMSSSSNTAGTISSITKHDAATSEPAYQAYLILRTGFIAAPIIAGADKFFHLLANWDMYLAPLRSPV